MKFNNQFVSESQLHKKAKNPDEIKMKSAYPMNYKFMNLPTKDGCCVQEYLLTTYKPYIPTLTIQKINEIMGDNPLDYGIEKGKDGNQVQKFCDYYKISRYSVDQTFAKKVYHPTNYPALIYYMPNEHMYPVIDAKTRNHLVRKDAAKHNATVNSLVINESGDLLRDLNYHVSRILVLIN